MKKILLRSVLMLSILMGFVVTTTAQAKKMTFSDSRVEGKILQIDFDSSNKEHIIMYIKWMPDKERDVIIDASTIAMIVSQNFPDVSTLSLCAVSNAATPTNALIINWHGVIDREAMLRINGQRIKDYAKKLYKPLFIEKKCIQG
jgi:hypothetical protein